MVVVLACVRTYYAQLLYHAVTYHATWYPLPSTQFPVSGKFSADQKVVYEAVLSAQRAVLEHMRPGVEWPHCHRVAEREIIAGQQKAGVIRPEFSVDEVAAAGVGAVFLPHGLGHLIGCDTHDVGG